MNKNLIIKIWVICTIVLFIGISNSSSAANINKNLDGKSNKIYKSKSFDNYKEIITYIDGYVYGFKINGIGFLFNVEMWGVDRTIDMHGYRDPIFPLGESNFFVSSDLVIASHFIGTWRQVTVDTYSINGIALGNVDWE